MRALTFIRPMSAAIVHGTKRIENRPRDLPKPMRGKPTIVAVHAGKGWSDEYHETVYDIDGVLGTGVNRRRPEYHGRVLDQGIVGLMRLAGRVYKEISEDDDCVYFDGETPPRSKAGPWYSGPYGYEIARAVAFATQVPCRGMLGFWTVPEGLLADLICGACGWHHPKGEPITGCVLR